MEIIVGQAFNYDKLKLINLMFSFVGLLLSR